METTIAETTAALLEDIEAANLDTGTIIETLQDIFAQFTQIPYIIDQIYEQIPIFSVYIGTAFLFLFTLFAIKMWKG